MLPSRSSSIPGLMSDREGDRDDIKGWQEEEGVIADGLHYHYQHRQEEERRNSLKRLSRYKEIEKHMLENPVGGKCEEEEYEDTELIHARKPKRRKSILKEGSHYPDSTRMTGMYFENQSETSSAQNESLSQQQKQRDDSYRRFPRVCLLISMMKIMVPCKKRMTVVLLVIILARHPNKNMTRSHVNDCCGIRQLKSIC